MGSEMCIRDRRRAGKGLQRKGTHRPSRRHRGRAHFRHRRHKPWRVDGAGAPGGKCLGKTSRSHGAEKHPHGRRHCRCHGNIGGFTSRRRRRASKGRAIKEDLCIKRSQSDDKGRVNQPIHPPFLCLKTALSHSSIVK